MTRKSAFHQPPGLATLPPPLPIRDWLFTAINTPRLWQISAGFYDFADLPCPASPAEVDSTDTLLEKLLTTVGDAGARQTPLWPEAKLCWAFVHSFPAQLILGADTRRRRLNTSFIPSPACGVGSLWVKVVIMAWGCLLDKFFWISFLISMFGKEQIFLKYANSICLIHTLWLTILSLLSSWENSLIIGRCQSLNKLQSSSSKPMSCWCSSLSLTTRLYASEQLLLTPSLPDLISWSSASCLFIQLTALLSLIILSLLRKLTQTRWCNTAEIYCGNLLLLSMLNEIPEAR